MRRQKVIIVNPSGLHLKPAGYLCNKAICFQSKISLLNAKGIFNAKSVLSVLAACVKEGDEIEVTCEGPDEEEALQTIVREIAAGLGEKLL